MCSVTFVCIPTPWRVSYDNIRLTMSFKKRHYPTPLAISPEKNSQLVILLMDAFSIASFYCTVIIINAHNSLCLLKLQNCGNSACHLYKGHKLPGLPSRAAKSRAYFIKLICLFVSWSDKKKQGPTRKIRFSIFSVI